MQTVDEKEQVDVLWIATITALRSVGHVLHEVDCANDIKLIEAANQWWTKIEVK